MSKNTELLGVKVKPETKDHISELIEKAKAAGMIEFNGDIYDLFVERFQHDELSTKVKYGADLKELNQITRRINDIFVNLAERNETNLENLRNQQETVNSNLNEEINALKEKNKEAKETLTEKESKLNELTDLLKVNQERTKELEDIQTSYMERIQEQKTIMDEKDEKITTKNEILSQKEETLVAMQEDIAQNQQLKKEIESLHTDITALQQKINSKNEELKKQKDNLEFECQKRVFTREQELNTEKNNEIKTIQIQLTKEINRSQEKYEKVLGEKDKLMNANYELKVSWDREKSDNEHKKSMITAKEQEIAELKKTIQQLKAAAKDQ